MDDDQTEEEVVEQEDYLDEPDEVEDVLDDRPMKVHDGLYIGSYLAEMNKNSLLRTGITDILQVAQGLFPHHPLIFNYMNIQVQDLPSEDLVRYFPKCFEFMDRAISSGGSVLVHCAAGVSRSVTVVLGYLMTRYKMELATAVEHLKIIRPWVSPNVGFLKQLEAYQGLSQDMSKWRAWQLVWHEQHGQQQDDNSQQQQWVQIPQVHSSCNQQQQEKDLNHSSNGILAEGTVAAVHSQRRTNSLDCSCHNSTGASSGVSISCNTGGAAAAAAVTMQQCQLSGGSWCSSRRFKYSSSAPECGSQSLANAACAAACAAAAAAGNVMVCNAHTSKHSSCLSGGYGNHAAASGTSSNGTSSNSGDNVAGLNISSTAFEPGLCQISRQQQQQQRRQQIFAAARPQRRHVSFVLDEAVTACDGLNNDTVMADAVPCVPAG